MGQMANPPEDREFQNHDPSAVPNILGPHTESCGTATEVRHDHPVYGPDLRWTCTRSRGHLGRHATSTGAGLVASWARKV